MKEPVYLALSILEISKTVIYKFWYDYIKSKYQNNGTLCYMDTEGVYEDIEDDVQKIREKDVIH